MKYENMVQGRFLSRPNRFIAMVEIDGKEEVCTSKIQVAAGNFCPMAQRFGADMTTIPNGKQNTI